MILNLLGGKIKIILGLIFLFYSIFYTFLYEIDYFKEAANGVTGNWSLIFRILQVNFLLI
jgi:hypothetical protein